MIMANSYIVIEAYSAGELQEKINDYARDDYKPISHKVTFNSTIWHPNKQLWSAVLERVPLVDRIEERVRQA